MGRQDYETETLIAHTLKGEGFDASEDGTGRGTPLVPVAFSIMPQNSGKDYKAREVEVAQPIMAGGPVGGNQGGDYIMQPVAFSAGDSGNDASFDIAPTIRKGGDGGGNQVAIAFSCKDHGADAAEDLSPTLRALGAYDANGGGQMAVAVPLQEVGKRTGVSTDDPRAGIGIGQDGDPMFTLQAGAQHGVATVEPYTLAIRGRGDTHNLEARQDGLANALLTPNGGRAGIGVGAVAAGMAVRRLTPVECERLQGFPDNYTNIPWRGKPEAPDGPRYKALGNSMAVPVMRWIGKRIANALA
jgi:hypothetical protein